MTSKRYRKLPKKTNELAPSLVEKLIPEMLNLLGCNKESFIQLIKSLKYKVKEIDGDVFFKYLPPKNVKNNKRIE